MTGSDGAGEPVPERTAEPARSDAPALRFLYVLLGAFAVLAGNASASDDVASDRQREEAVTVYEGQGVDANLIHVLPDLFLGDLIFEKTYFTAVGYYRRIDTPAFLQSFFGWLGVPGTNIGFEVIAAKHYGLQRNAEADLSYLLRFARFSLGPLWARFGAGFGLSYAMGRPTYEDGSFEDPEKRYRFQYYGSYELEWGYGTTQRITLVTRIHHRSGIYGIIAPPHVGSNFMTAGIRYHF